ncbi:hypothetical protein PTSG_13254 [Salpingoeca rosetta]|uniref:Uncharacterized protein n=1 Tax=Salpingoeca rosetta (strain ATCC 50818 / BSB-021) TaxID=946362 RepID=F2UFE7_SALR5|nr:uncharacterized protein PTSG_13254 [Salpingoeca rosetta]EGD75347.1 hypothetical protein PTSG_13254 [Salpingoeca rosetta]|eukprot:XP_004992400.1 hypothetical protein PTSG_13254 [Salpingoeca rosetta]
MSNVSASLRVRHPTHPPPPMQQQQRMHHHRLLLNTSPNQPTHRPLLLLAGSWLPAAGNRCRQDKLHFRLEPAEDEGNVKDTCHACQVYSPHTWYEQLWTHTSMVIAGTSNHSDAVISAVTAITVTIAIDCTAAITRRPTTAPIWREADIAHVSRSDEEQQLMCGCILYERALCLSSISSSSSSWPSLVNSSGCGHGCGDVMGCNVRRCAVASHDDDDGGVWWIPHDTSRAIHAHTQMCQRRRHEVRRCRCVCVCVCGQASSLLLVCCCDEGRACACAVRRVPGCTEEDKEGHGPDDDGGRGM